jgi:hypothetical protein
MKLEEFNPANPELDINGTIVTFNLFSLYNKAWAFTAFATKEQPNGLSNLVEGLKSLDKVIIARIAWRLVKNKREIGEEVFYDWAEKRENIMAVLTAINKVFEISQPGTRANERMRELKKS